jgi:hypothetical protein
MQLELSVLGGIAVSIALLFIGAWINRAFERRPSLVSYYGHIAAFKHKVPDGTRADIHTHTVILKNDGKKSAKNVRVRHSVLPDFVVYPSVEYTVVDLPEGGREIVFPTLVPAEQLTISYLYFPPLTWTGVNAGIRSDEGIAKAIPMDLQRQWPKWLGLTSLVFTFLGVVAAIYLLYRATVRLVA